MPSILRDLNPILDRPGAHAVIGLLPGGGRAESGVPGRADGVRLREHLAHRGRRPTSPRRPR
ncbi:hypothetical protein ACFYTS_20345 [Nocardia sp. NPDC004151]|uniref:hypothetical protein n=1 Tax=Nocardia sp. NPDC004151 TaxID=3364304 RepID=UPI0036978CE1